jgi:hypothetical protein
MDALGQAGSEYRWNYYKSGLTGEVADLDLASIIQFLDLALLFIDHSLRANRRETVSIILTIPCAFNGFSQSESSLRDVGRAGGHPLFWFAGWG